MPPRRAGRDAHVRPRPPSTGRPTPQRVRRPAPDAYRLRQARGIEGRRRGLPLPTRLVLAVAVVALGAVIFVGASGGLGSLVRAFGTSFSGFVDQIAATPTPSSTPIVIAGAPTIASPTEPYTNQATVDLEITVPDSYVGDSGVHVRVYLALSGQVPSPIAEVPVGSTASLIVPVELTDGRNDLTATIIEAGIESEASPVVTFILDTTPPEFTLTSPHDGQTLNAASVTIAGTTQPRTTLLARNAANGTSISGQAGTDGTFSLDLALEKGANEIRLSGTDPAGNAGSTTFTVTRGDGTLTAALSASAYSISVKSLPVSLQLGVLVTDPDGAPLAGATVTFNLTVPGIPPVSKEATTGADGRATFTTTLPTGVTTGPGLATALVATDAFGTTSANRAITVRP